MKIYAADILSDIVSEVWTLKQAHQILEDVWLYHLDEISDQDVKDKINAYFDKDGNK